MPESHLFTIENFYHFAKERKLMAAQCDNCGTLLVPPRPVCTNCLSKNLEWIKLKPKGKLLTYTVIHVASPRFQSLAPYAVGIVKLEDGPNLPGMIKGIEPENIKVGMDVLVDFDTNIPAEWPMWPRYFFRPS
ncbi:MAG: Zn-ribbon domain-containing OB-fold protein [Candidatus Bathyarchaeota archaeon]|nr:Zn-ribbon domain-containing OB-fold protein [Candidatus Bathyarchaeota archaeon]MDH5779535.1 Zn-ribbon domain-containing OB-fold protein [Candidatus Bathyarchaeota archaeon]